jgi:hypothetical protein
MRARDLRAIVFCVGTTLALFFVSYLLFQSVIASLALAGAAAAWLVTRPRMQRVMRRLRGDPDWSGYFRND